MRVFPLLLFTALAAATTSLERRMDLFNTALYSLIDSVTELEDSLVGAILLYPSRTTCPHGFEPAVHLDGRLPVVGIHEVGRVSQHSLHDETPYALNATCERMISVSENGFVNVCQHSSQQMASSLNMKQAVPSFSVLACMRKNIVYAPP
jgi:hypothetical protein